MQSKSTEKYQEAQLKNLDLAWLITAMEKWGGFFRKASENETVIEIAKNSKTAVDKGIEIVKKYPLQTAAAAIFAVRFLRKNK